MSIKLRELRNLGNVYIVFWYVFLDLQSSIFDTYRKPSSSTPNNTALHTWIVTTHKRYKTFLLIYNLETNNFSQLLC